ncbi:MAG: hypothetical protein V4568_12620 [Pseudomonadota bacterium]
MMSVDVVRPIKASTFLEFSPQPFQLDPSERIDRDKPVVHNEQAPVHSAAWSLQEITVLAQQFVDRTEHLLDAAHPPAWEDEDDIFDGEIFAEEQTKAAEPSQKNLTISEKREILHSIFAHEFSSAEDAKDDPLSYLGLALYYRRQLLDEKTTLADKREILKRIYTQEPPKWIDDEIVMLHFILLDQCRYLSRASSNVERKKDLLQWIFTDTALEDKPFSFKNSVMLVTNNPPQFGAVYARVKECLSELVPGWIEASVRNKQIGLSHQPDLFTTG